MKDSKEKSGAQVQGMLYSAMNILLHAQETLDAEDCGVSVTVEKEISGELGIMADRVYDLVVKFN